MTYQIIITFKILQFFTSCLTKLAKYFLLLWSANRRSQRLTVMPVVKLLQIGARIKSPWLIHEPFKQGGAKTFVLDACHKLFPMNNCRHSPYICHLLTIILFFHQGLKLSTDFCIILFFSYSIL